MATVKQTEKPTKAKQLRELITSGQTEFILEAHNGLSARIAEEAGFKGIWGSGLSLSAQFGVRDNNEASWTQIVDMLEFMSDATTIPILLDGDTGYGDFNNMRRLVRKLEQREIGGVCIEDKLFPKTNSFIGGEKQALADIDEFCGKIKAGKDSQSDDDFSIVARVEALIAGWGLDEAIKRGEAYRQAGADAILIHSKLSRADEILAFAEEWANRAPLIIVPTKYYSTPTDVFRQANISLVIWANHMLRASVAAMQKTASVIHETESLIETEDRIASVSEIFRLQGADELAKAEKRYAQGKSLQTAAVILAASRGDGLEPVTDQCPKVMLPVAGKPVLRRLVDEFKQQGVNDIHVVAGYKPDAIDVQGITKSINSDYDSTGELQSLICGMDGVKQDTILLYGDVLFRSYILEDLLDASGEIVAVVDSGATFEKGETTQARDLAYCSSPDNRAVFHQDVVLEHISEFSGSQNRKPDGRWIGMLRVQGEGKVWLSDAIEALKERNDFSNLSIPDLLEYLVSIGKPINVLYINGHWLDINNIDDLSKASDFAHAGQS